MARGNVRADDFDHSLSDGLADCANRRDQADVGQKCPGQLLLDGERLEFVYPGSFSATTLLVLGSLIGIFMNGTQNRSRTKANLQRFDPLLWLPFLVPGVLVGILLIFVFNRDWSVGFYRSVGIIVLALCIRYAGAGWSMIRHAFASVDPELTEAAAIDGANRWQLFRHVRWFQMREELAVVWYLVYLLCLRDAETLVLIIPPGRETLALRITTCLHYGHNPQVNALCLTLLGLADFATGFVERIRANWTILSIEFRRGGYSVGFDCTGGIVPERLLSTHGDGRCGPEQQTVRPG